MTSSASERHLNAPIKSTLFFQNPLPKQGIVLIGDLYSFFIL